MSEESPVYLFLTYYCNQHSERWHPNRLLEYDGRALADVVSQVDTVLRMGLPRDRKILSAPVLAQESSLEDDLNQYIQKGKRSQILSAALHPSAMPDLANLVVAMRPHGVNLRLERGEDPFHFDEYDMLLEAGILCGHMQGIKLLLDESERKRLDRQYSIVNILEDVPESVAVIASPDDAYIAEILGRKRLAKVVYPDTKYPESYSTLLKKDFALTGEPSEELVIRAAAELRFGTWLKNDGIAMHTGDQAAHFYASELPANVLASVIHPGPLTPESQAKLWQTFRQTFSRSYLPSAKELCTMLSKNSKPSEQTIQ